MDALRGVTGLALQEWTKCVDDDRVLSRPVNISEHLPVVRCWKVSPASGPLIRSPTQEDAIKAAARGSSPSAGAPGKRPREMNEFPRKFGSYVLLKPLAQGGMGSLYLAYQGEVAMEKFCVIKTVLPHLADAEYVARFRDEAKVVVKLSHGNLIPVFDAGWSAASCSSRWTSWRAATSARVVEPLRKEAGRVPDRRRGLHRQGAVPRARVRALVSRSSPRSPRYLAAQRAGVLPGEVKLTDFGLASSTLKLEKTAPGIIYGKVAYMSPEQARGEKLDGRSDMYATGIVLWELLTGRQLFPPRQGPAAGLCSAREEPRAAAAEQARAARARSSSTRSACGRSRRPEDRYTDCDAMRRPSKSGSRRTHRRPTATRMSTFLQELFAEDIGSERAERTSI